MIGRVVRGWRAYGLVAYLFGPGRYHEHDDPHVVAAWDGCARLHQPPVVRGRFDVGRLVAALTAPAAAAGVPQRPPAGREGQDRPQGPVWHCSLRTAPGDRELSDAEWSEIVADLVDRVGIARRGDPGGCRWVAVRHAVDHVHVVAVLVRQDTLRRVHPRRDYLRVRQACLAAEATYGLTRTSPADRTAPQRAERAEVEKAVREHRPEPTRDRLRRLARSAAARATGPEEFVALLAAEPAVELRLRRDSAGRLLGYALADRRDQSPGGLVWFGGRRLAADLSAPRLAERWASAARLPSPVGVGRLAAQRAALAAATAAAKQARTALVTDGPGVAHVTGDLLLVLADSAEGPAGGPLTSAAADFERAARHPGRGQPIRWGPAAADLRAAAWRLARVGPVRATGRALTGPAVLALLVAVAALVAELAAWREQHGHQAAAAGARRAGETLAGRAAALGALGEGRVERRPRTLRGSTPTPRGRGGVVEQPHQGRARAR
ncbi:relaxase/mobilization nuclease domain-containing protein [Amycolatopsis arida]|uniref:relaxase/mobilization nuclease domain-containing protein n=1 Tax=Amycolatopsis arida TaxID=587909 RepID=UPI0010646C30|nr:relaxase [Amycolatopsis arida]TDX84931.1 hypothetical protein CLV69_11715 [Amycolatopsis arida]